VAHLVFAIIFLIITIVQVVVGLIAWLVWYIIRKVVESECTQVGDHCVCHADKDVPFTGKEKETIYVITFLNRFPTSLSAVVSNRLLFVLIEPNRP